MAEPAQQAILHYYQGAYGPTLLLRTYEEAQLGELKAIFLSLAKGEGTRVGLKGSRLTKTLDGCDDLVFVLLVREHEPSRMVTKTGETANGPLFDFRRRDDGWRECAELLDGLNAPGHQYLSRGGSDEALVVVTYQEHLRKP